MLRGAGPLGAGDLAGRPSQVWPDRVGDDLGHGLLVPFTVCVVPLREASGDDQPVAFLEAGCTVLSFWF